MTFVSIDVFKNVYQYSTTPSELPKARLQPWESWGPDPQTQDFYRDLSMVAPKINERIEYLAR